MALIIAMDQQKLQGITEPLSKAINKAQQKGYTIDEVLVGLMVMLGSAIKQRGASLNTDAPLRDALPPIVHGYEMDFGDVIGGLQDQVRKQAKLN